MKVTNKNAERGEFSGFSGSFSGFIDYLCGVFGVQTAGGFLGFVRTDVIKYLTNTSV